MEQNSCGQVMIGLIKHIIKINCGHLFESFDICLYMILTMPRMNKDTHRAETYSNWEHYDDDETSTETGILINEYLLSIDHYAMHDYFNEMRLIYPEYSKNRYPLPATCCWSLIDPGGISSLFVHKQHFIVTESGISFDISSDVLHHGERQLGGTFYGKLASHLTSCSVWVMPEDGWVTTINTGIANMGWGQNGGYAYQRKVGEDRSTSIRNLITGYMVANNGAIPNLPGVNVEVFMQNDGEAAM